MKEDTGASTKADQALVASDGAATHLHPSGFDPSRMAIAKCIEIVRRVRDDFLSPEFATDQPLASFSERFACDQAAQAIENEFGMGTIEQCRLLGKPTPFEQFQVAIAGETRRAETPQDGSAGTVSTRAESIAQRRHP